MVTMHTPGPRWTSAPIITGTLAWITQSRLMKASRPTVSSEP